MTDSSEWPTDSATGSLHAQCLSAGLWRSNRCGKAFEVVVPWQLAGAKRPEMFGTPLHVEQLTATFSQLLDQVHEGNL